MQFCWKHERIGLFTDPYRVLDSPNWLKRDQLNVVFFQPICSDPPYSHTSLFVDLKTYGEGGKKNKQYTY